MIHKGGTLGQKIATAFWAPKETKSEAPHETLLTILLQPAPMNTLSTSQLDIFYYLFFTLL